MIHTHTRVHNHITKKLQAQCAKRQTTNDDDDGQKRVKTYSSGTLAIAKLPMRLPAPAPALEAVKPVDAPSDACDAMPNASDGPLCKLAGTQADFGPNDDSDGTPLAGATTTFFGVTLSALLCLTAAEAVLAKNEAITK